MTDSLKILPVGDQHAKPGIDNDRFEALGNFCVENRPDIIILMGDLYDMESLSTYDMGTVHSWHRNYEADIEAGNDAVARLTSVIQKETKKLVNLHKKRWNPELICLMGNHEQRIDRFVVNNPHLEGAISKDDFVLKEWGWKVVHFLEPYTVWAGKRPICFQHYFTSGVMGKAIGSVTPAKANVSKNLVSSVFGHSHLRDYWETTDVLGRSIFGLETGCFFGHNEHYSSECDRWWRGLVMLEDVTEMGQEPHFFGYDRVLRDYL